MFKNLEQTNKNTNNRNQKEYSMTKTEQSPFHLSVFSRITGKFGLIFPNEHYEFNENNEEAFQHAIETLIEKAKNSKLNYLEYIPIPSKGPNWVGQVDFQKIGFRAQDAHVYEIDLDHAIKEPSSRKRRFQVYINRANTEDDFVEIEELLGKLSPDDHPIKIKEKHFKNALEHGRVISIHDLGEEHKPLTSKPLVAMGTLLLSKHSKNGYFKDVIRNPKYTGNKLGEILMCAMLNTAKAADLEHITLTNSPKRNGSHELYLKKGFTFLEGVHPYRLMLKKTKG